MGSVSTRSAGVLTSWNDERGFGFVTLDDGERIFAHISAFPPRDARPAPGERLDCAVEHTSDGKVRARNIRYVSPTGRVIRTRKRNPGAMSSVILATFGVTLVVITAIGALPWLFAALYLLLSIITYFVYATDKSAAQSKQWRVSESVLLSLGLCGGWPGALVAQQRLRHKTQKPRYRQAFWGTVILNLLVLAILTTALRDPLLEFAQLLLAAASA